MYILSTGFNLAPLWFWNDLRWQRYPLQIRLPGCRSIAVRFSKIILFYIFIFRFTASETSSKGRGRRRHIREHILHRKWVNFFIIFKNKCCCCLTEEFFTIAYGDGKITLDFFDSIYGKLTSSLVSTKPCTSPSSLNKLAKETSMSLPMDENNVVAREGPSTQNTNDTTSFWRKIKFQAFKIYFVIYVVLLHEECFLTVDLRWTMMFFRKFSPLKDFIQIFIFGKMLMKVSIFVSECEVVLEILLYN